MEIGKSYLKFSGEINPNVNEWETETPKDIRAGALRDLVKNYTTAFSCLKKRVIDKINMGFCKRKSTPSIEVPLSSISASNKASYFVFIFSDGRHILATYTKIMTDKLPIATKSEPDKLQILQA